jgi:TPR repeat protein
LPLTQKTDMATAQTFTEIDRLDSKQVEQIDLAVQQNHASINKISSGIITQNKVKVIAENKNTQMDDPVLLFSSGEKYFNGKGVQKNKQEAFKWYRKSAKLGYAKAEYRLGEMYHYGFGISEDHNEAVKWYTRSAMQGNKSAQHNLAIIYDRGEGVTLDSTKAYAWITIAASQGHPESINYEDYYYQRLNNSQKIEAEKLVQQLHKKIFGTPLFEDKYKKYKRQIKSETASFLAESYKTTVNWLFGDDLNDKNSDQEKKWSTAYGALLFLLLFLMIWGVFNIWGRNKNKTEDWR